MIRDIYGIIRANKLRDICSPVASEVSSYTRGNSRNLLVREVRRSKVMRGQPSAHAQKRKFHVLLSLWRVPRSGGDGEFVCWLYLVASSFTPQIHSLYIYKIIYLCTDLSFGVLSSPYFM